MKNNDLMVHCSFDPSGESLHELIAQCFKAFLERELGTLGCYGS